MFNLIPTDPDEYKIYADWLEDQDKILTSSVRRGTLSFVCIVKTGEAIHPSGEAETWRNVGDPVLVCYGFGTCWGVRGDGSGHGCLSMNLPPLTW